MKPFFIFIPKFLNQVLTDGVFAVASTETARRHTNKTFFYLYDHRNNHAFTENSGNVSKEFGKMMRLYFQYRPRQRQQRKIFMHFRCWSRGRSYKFLFHAYIPSSNTGSRFQSFAENGELLGEFYRKWVSKYRTRISHNLNLDKVITFLFLVILTVMKSFGTHLDLRIWITCISRQTRMS